MPDAREMQQTLMSEKELSRPYPRGIIRFSQPVRTPFANAFHLENVIVVV